VTRELLVASVDMISYRQHYNAPPDLSTPPTRIPGLWMSQDSVSQPMDRDECLLADPKHRPTTVKLSEKLYSVNVTTCSEITVMLFSQ
jgi:hypothetical protein